MNLTNTELENTLSYRKLRWNQTIQELTADDFKRPDPEGLIKSCFEYINYIGTKIRDLSTEECDYIKNFIIQEKKINVSFKDKLIALDHQQLQFAKRMNYGQFILRGAGGTGKTVRLIGRAIHLAETHQDFKILFITSKKHLLGLIQPNFAPYSNIYSFFKKDFCDAHPSYARMFNAVLVDELQDFNIEDIEKIKNSLVDPEKSHFVGAIDGAQTTLSKPYKLSLVVSSIELLTQNYRNADKILDYIKQKEFVDSDSNETSSKHYDYYHKTTSIHTGFGHVDDPNPYDSELNYSALTDQIDRYSQSIPYNEIAVIIIGPHEVLADIQSELEKNWIPTSYGYDNKNTVKLLPNNQANGLKFTIVLLIINMRIAKSSRERSEILSATRAREILHVIRYEVR